MSSKEIISLIEQFETSFDTYQQIMQKNNKEIIQNMSNTWKKMKTEQAGNEKLLQTIRDQNSELTGLRTESEGLDKKIDELKNKKDEIISKVTELNNNLETLSSDLKKPQFELETLISKLNSVNEKISTKESEKTSLDQKKIENENRETDLQSSFSKKMEEIELKITDLKKNNFFSSFIIENSDEEIHEVDILATILIQGTCNLDDIKKQLDVPPIMAVRTIKQLALKGIINLNEDTNEITLP